MKLSIITVNLNNANGLETTLNSLYSQSDRNFDLFVIDGCSADNSIEIAHKYNSIISKLLSEPDNGLFDAQNKGIELSNSSYLLFLNSGDYLIDNSIVAKFNSEMCDKDLIIGDIVFSLPSGLKWRRYYNSIKLSERFFYLESLPHCCTFINKDLFYKTGLYSEKYKICSDYDFFINAIQNLNASIRFLNYPISVFDTTGISSDKSMKLEHFEERDEIFIKYYGRKRFIHFKTFNFYYATFFKKIPYIYNLIKSYF